MSFSASPLVHATAQASGAGNNITTGAIDTTGADLLVVVVADFAGGTATVLSDSKSNTWTGLTVRTPASNRRTQIYYCKPTSVGSGHTFTGTSTGAFPALAVMAWSGAHATPFDVQNGNTATDATPQTTGSVTPSQINSLVIAAFSSDGAAGTINSGFTVSDSTGSAGTEAVGAAYLVETTIASQNPQWSSVGAAGMSSAIAVFKPALNSDLLAFFF